MPRPRTPFHRRKGVIAVFVAIALTSLIAVAAVAIDGGLLYLHLRKARTTADAAAMAAACEIFREYPRYQGKDTNGKALAAALNVARSNGYDNDGTTSKVTVNVPPTSGIYAGKAGYAEVLVEYNVNRAFSRIWGTEPIPVRSRAVSRGAWVGSHAGIIILDYEDRASLNSRGNGSFTELGGPVIVNSNNPNAVVVGGNGTMYAPEFLITGGVQLAGNADFQTVPVPGQIHTGMHPTPDPLAYLPPPDVPADGNMTIVNLGKGNRQYTLTPGRYTNLPNFSQGDVVILKQASHDGQGIYYIDGGGFKSTGATVIMDPTTTGGVMIYNAPRSHSQSHKLQITGHPSGMVDLAPLTEGPYAGMMLWQDRNSSVDILVEGNGAFNLKGTIYAAKAKLDINGNGTGTTGYYLDDKGQEVYGASRIGSQFIVGNLSLGGNGNILIHYHGPDVARTRIITLVE